LHFLPCKEIISCMFYLKDYQLQWISFWLNQFIRKTGQKHWNRWCQFMDKISRIFGILFLVDFLFSSLTTPNVFIVMVLKWWLPIMKFHHQRKQVSTCIILVLKEVKFLAFLALQRNYFMYVLPNGLVFRECKHIKNIFEDVYFTKNSFPITLIMTSWN
jgi:hypothetical protein